jgi:ArsR family transcriptional regulator
MTTDLTMKALIKVMKAVSDPTRIRILKMLEKKTMCVCEIHTALGTAQSTASKHLKLLEDAGLVSYRKDGLWVNYFLADGSQSPFAGNFLGNLRHWLNDDPEIDRLLKAVETIDRCQILNISQARGQCLPQQTQRTVPGPPAPMVPETLADPEEEKRV